MGNEQTTGLAEPVEEAPPWWRSRAGRRSDLDRGYRPLIGNKGGCVRSWWRNWWEERTSAVRAIWELMGQVGFETLL